MVDEEINIVSELNDVIKHCIKDKIDSLENEKKGRVHPILICMALATAMGQALNVMDKMKSVDAPPSDMFLKTIEMNRLGVCSNVIFDDKTGEYSGTKQLFDEVDEKLKLLTIIRDKNQWNKKESMMRKLGFNKELDLVKEGRCPFCGKFIIRESEFRDKKSDKEFEISGLCQKCQDIMFG